ncbi:MAG: hypothetical protein DRN90_03010 [Thermoproteota archaeon]|nr:MAG: hypothetical protein DRN90_03010 [Candidatus Korarchaeota archaeon]
MGRSLNLTRKKLFLMILAVSLTIWIVINRPGRFGINSFEFTVYSAIPFPYVDLKIHTNGWPTLREKSHYLAYEEIEDLLEENPEVIIIGIGHSNSVKVDEKILGIERPIIEVLNTPKAIARFNELKSKGVKVAAIIHSTC